MKEGIAFEILDIEFLFGGNLGKLQQKTIYNKEVCNSLLINGVITRDEYNEAMKEINDYFLKQIKEVVDNPQFYTSL